MPPLLDVRNLRVQFCAKGRRGEITDAVCGLSFTIEAGRILAMVGGSGSGKSVTALALARLLPPEPGCRISGSILYDGRDVARLSERELRRLRGRHIAYVFQEPCASLNPAYTVAFQIAEAIKQHFPETKNIRQHITCLLEEVGIRDAEKRLDAHPHELSGGMAQRVMIAMALACQPKLLVADEPTTALDATIQRQILELLAHLRARHRMAILLITHNFGIVSGFADEVAVMAEGLIVEHGKTDRLLSTPQHPKTCALLDAIPRIGQKPHTPPMP